MGGGGAGELNLNSYNTRLLWCYCKVKCAVLRFHGGWRHGHRTQRSTISRWRKRGRKPWETPIKVTANIRLALEGDGKTEAHAIHAKK